jgi:hypothetical protein
LCRGTNEYKTGYLSGTNLVKDENGNLCADSCSILNKQTINTGNSVHGIDHIGQTEIHAIKPLVPESSSLEAEIAM